MKKTFEVDVYVKNRTNRNLKRHKLLNRDCVGDKSVASTCLVALSRIANLRTLL